MLEKSKNRSIESSNHRTGLGGRRNRTIEPSNHRTIEASKRVLAVENSNHRIIEPSNRVQALEKSNYRIIEPSKNRTIESGRERTTTATARDRARARDVAAERHESCEKKYSSRAIFSRVRRIGAADGARRRPCNAASRARARVATFSTFRLSASCALSVYCSLSLQDKSRAVE